MKISEIAEKSGLTRSRIRFYEAEGLLGGVRRQGNGYREFPPEALQLLEIITGAQQAGFTLDEIKSLLPAADGKGWHHAELLTSLRRKVEDIEELQRRLKRTRAQLLTIIEGIETRPAGLGCKANTERVLAQVRARRS